MHHPRVKRLAGLGVSAMVLAAIPVMGFNLLGVASADDGGSSTPGTATKSLVINGQALTSDQIECMTDHGFAPPEPVAQPGVGQFHTETKAGDTDKFAAFKAAADACGVPAPKAGAPGEGGSFGVINGTPLTDEQMQCLTDHGAPPPSLKKGAAPGPISEEQGQEEADAFRAAAKACGLPAVPNVVIGSPGTSIESGAAKEA